MLDIHAHLLPGIDDGPADLAAAVALATALRRQGITQAVTTPHWMSPRFPTVLPAGIATAHAALRTALPDGPEVLLGAEVHLAGVGGAEAFADAVRPLGDGPCVLVELPDEHLPGIAWDALFTLRRRGLRPILAHPERCRGLDPAAEPLAAFLASGAKARVRDFALAHGVHIADFPDDLAFANANTPADLAALEARV